MEEFSNLNEFEAANSDSVTRDLMEISWLKCIGWMYSRTRLPIKTIRRKKAKTNKYAVIVTDNDYEYEVDITGDSWSAMIFDIAKFITFKF